MLDILTSTIKNVLIALYQPFWFALVLAILLMFFFMYANKKHANITTGIKILIRSWIQRFKKESSFRKFFGFVFYVVLILFKTLFSRAMHLNPVTNVIGVWGLYKESEGKLVFTTEVIENMVMFIPFTFLLLYTFRERIVGKFLTCAQVVWKSTQIAFLFSFTIEMLQLFLRLGTWQLSDLFFNTLGGVIGGLIYYIGYKIKHKGKTI